MGVRDSGDVSRETEEHGKVGRGYTEEAGRNTGIESSKRLDEEEE